MNENTGSNRGPEIRRRVFRSNRWTGPSRTATGSAETGPATTGPESPATTGADTSGANTNSTDTSGAEAGNAGAGSTDASGVGTTGHTELSGADSVVFAALPRAAVEAFAGRDGEVPRFVVHLAVVTADLSGAANLARALVRSLAFMPEIDGGETTVSEEDNQGVRHRVFCDRLLPDRRRCAMRHAHAGRCRPTPPLPPPPTAAAASTGRR